MDYAALRAEIQEKCTPGLIASRNESAIAAIVNEGRTTTIQVKVMDVKKYLYAINVWGAIKTAANGSAGPVRDCAQALIDFAASGIETFDVTFDLVDMQLGYLVSGGIITQQNKDVIQSMAVVNDPVSAIDVATALGL